MKSYFISCSKIALFFTVVCIACKKKNSNTVIQNCVYVPTYIDTTISLSDISFFGLKTKGYAFTRYGSRRIVLYKESDTKYRAFDRASSYRMSEIGCLLKVNESGFFLQDTCSGSKFSFDGNVIQDPATCPLLEYTVSFIGSDQLRIFHSP
jgi:hypothetical protein